VRRLHRFGGHGPVAHGDRFAFAVVNEGLAAGSQKRRLRLRIDLQVQALEDDERDEQLIDVQAMAAEHALGAHRTERGQQFEAVIDQRLAHGELS
jgi:hypothetical protein